jgi:hypothetical protein
MLPSLCATIHDGTTLIVSNDVERIFADIDPDTGD